MSDAPVVERKANPLKSFLSGGFGGICNVLCGHPLDTIKVRLQTMPRPEPGAEPMYRGAFDCAQKTVRREGFRGLYKGMSAPLTGVAPIFATCFAGYALGKRVQQSDSSAKLTYTQIFIAGSFSGIFSTFIMAPGERIKCLLQVQQAAGGERKYNGLIDTAVKLYKEGGLRSVFRGGCATALRDTMNRSNSFICTWVGYFLQSYASVVCSLLIEYSAVLNFMRLLNGQDNEP